MDVLGLDLSTSTGWCHFAQAGSEWKLCDYGTIELPKPVLEYGPYPACYLDAIEEHAGRICEKAREVNPDRIVIEETNLSKGSRYSQKVLEFIHSAVLRGLRALGFLGRVVYVSSSEWRKKLDVRLRPEDKAANKVLARAKKAASEAKQKLDKTKLGIRGKITLKHVAIRYVEEKFKIELSQKDNDQADAICLAYAEICGAKHCDGR